MKVKVRLRQLFNDKWIVEVKHWWSGWVAVYLERKFNARGATVSRQPVGSDDYILTWHNTRAEALITFNNVKALYGHGF